MGAWLEKCILSGGSRGEAGGRAGSPLFLDHNEARWAENVFLETARTPLPPPNLSGGLDPPLIPVTRCALNMITV